VIEENFIFRINYGYQLLKLSKFKLPKISTHTHTSVSSPQGCQFEECELDPSISFLLYADSTLTSTVLKTPT
jgi:hypothetical protein